MTGPAVQIAFYRTLYSQSAASVTAGCVATALTDRGCAVALTLLEKRSHDNARLLLSARPGPQPLLLLKPNFQDAADSLGLAAALRDLGRYRGLYLFGPYATLNAHELMRRFPSVDGIILGEPEVAAVALWERGGHHEPGTVPGVLSRRADGTLADGGPAPLPSLDAYRWPRRDIERQERAALANLEASRGCIAACSFCHVPVLAGAGARRRSRPITDVVDEMLFLHQDLHKDYLVFNDSLFWSGPRDDPRIDELIATLRSRDDWGGTFMIYLRTNPMLDPRRLHELAEVGLIRVFLGVESADPETLKLYRKGARPDAYDTVKERLRAARISHHIGFLMFGPFTRLEQLRTDVAFLARHDQLHRLGVLLEPARLIPGSRLLARTADAGLLTEPHAVSGDRAYGYTFVDPRVGSVLSALTRLVTEALDGQHRALEYFHTSAEFLEYLLVRRLGVDAAPALRPPGLLAARAELRDELGRILGRLIDAAAGTPHAALDASTERHAAAALRRLLTRTEAEHADWFGTVASAGHDDLVASVFTSTESAR